MAGGLGAHLDEPGEGHGRFRKGAGEEGEARAWKEREGTSKGATDQPLHALVIYECLSSSTEMM